MMSFNIWMVWSFSYGRRLIIADYAATEIRCLKLAQRLSWNQTRGYKHYVLDFVMMRQYCSRARRRSWLGWQRFSLAATLLIVSGCRFSVAPFDLGHDFEPGDLSSSGRDLDGHDLAPPDMLPPFVPSHVAASYWHPNAEDLPTDVIAIDTSALTINGAAPPTGITFVADSVHPSWAVLSIGAWGLTQDVTVTGSRALIIIASRGVSLGGVIDVSAKGSAPGPGASSGGVGAGGAGTSSGDSDGGGGGAGFGTPGQPGGNSDSVSGPGGTAGMSYGSGLTFFGGGANGGDGGGQTKCNDKTQSRGGGGGGALQISSSTAITVQASGGVNGGGGGGGGGCGMAIGNAAAGGGGGGSGGMIFLESPIVAIAGKLGANGGGGGGSADGVPTPHTDGTPGGDGALATTPAPGGSGGQGGGLFQGPDSASGGLGATSTGGATVGGSNTNGGGSGGAVGRIWLRTRGNAPIMGAGAVVSPTPSLDSTL
jgi:hypothetical protein